MPARLIVIATDGSAAAAKAVEVGLELAAAQASDVVFVHFSPAAGPLFAANPQEGPSQAEIEAADPVLRAAAEAARTRRVQAKLELGGATALVTSRPRSPAWLGAWMQA